MIPPSLAAIGAAVAFCLGAGSAYQLTANHYEAAAAEERQAAAEAYQQRTEDYNQASAELERAKNEKQIVYRTITKRVETYIDRPIYLRDAYDDDGVRDVNATFAESADPSQPDARVPAADTTGRQDRRPRPAEND